MHRHGNRDGASGLSEACLYHVGELVGVACQLLLDGDGGDGDDGNDMHNIGSQGVHLHQHSEADSQDPGPHFEFAYDGPSEALASEAPFLMHDGEEPSPSSDNAVDFADVFADGDVGNDLDPGPKEADFEPSPFDVDSDDED